MKVVMAGGGKGVSNIEIEDRKCQIAAKGPKPICLANGLVSLNAKLNLVGAKSSPGLLYKPWPI